jgi:hypothetical protein
MEKIRLEFRRGGDWKLTPGFWFGRNIQNKLLEYIPVRPSETKEAYDWAEYAGPFELEIVKPEPKPLKIEGYREPQVSDSWGLWSVKAHLDHLEGACSLPIRAHGSTRREAIERYNILARAMGATDDV